MINKLIHYLLVFFCVILMIPSLLAETDDGIDRAEDLEAISALMWHYARALDTFNADAYAALFTEDGEFKAGTASYKGKDALRKMINDTAMGRENRAKESGQPVATMYHMTTDSWTEFVADDRALHHTYFLTAVAPTQRGEPPNVLAVGRGVDELVKINGRWLIKKRDVTPQDE